MVIVSTNYLARSCNISARIVQVCCWVMTRCEMKSHSEKRAERSEEVGCEFRRIRVRGFQAGGIVSSRNVIPFHPTAGPDPN